MNELHTKILDAARDEVAKEYGHDSWQEVEQSTRWSHKDDLHEEAALLAMEKQAGFHFWIMANYHYNPTTETWQDPRDIMGEYDELELYNIWREGK